MRAIDYLILILAGALVVAGFAFAWWPLGLIAAGGALGVGWYWLIDGGTE